MNDMKRDLIRIQELVGMAFSETGSLVALTDGGQMNPNKLQKTLEQTMEQFERTTLELRRLCERYSPGAGGFAHRPALPYMDITGSVETFGYGWLHITLHTLLPHCRYQTPNWLSDTLRRLLDEYEACGKKLPFYSRAMLVIDEHTGIEGRHIYDQDNKGWKAISNAIKGRLIPDDDQHNAGTPKVFICAMHPTNPECADLLTKKDSDLRKIIETRDIPCEDKTRNAAMRTAIWSYYGDDLQVNSVELDVTKGDAKPIWEKLQKYLPVYSLFQADRKNSDSDSEVQDPLHAAVKEILQDEGISQTLDHVAEIVEGKLQEVATRTLEKLREMSPDIANTLSPVIPPASSLKWADVFKAVTISGDESIPINKRGSGSKRLILLNFFRAEVERRKDEANAPGIIYAIEEPETSQHSENQKKLINALITLSAESNVQVIITTHSAVLVNALDFKNIRLICADGSRKRVEAVHSGQLPFPSLNEVNYLAFSEISEGYHDELYGYLEEQGWLNEYKQGKTTVSYKKINTNGTTREQQICMTEYIRHQIHHPENTYNARFNDLQLRRSIEDMRAFVTSKAQTSGTT